MKNTLMIISLFVMIFLVSCSSDPKYTIVKTGTETNAATPYNSTIMSGDISIIGETTIQGCEYFVLHTYGNNIIVHKGNCKNPIHYKMCDSTKFFDRLEKDSLRIKFLEMKLEISEKVNSHQYLKK